MLKDIIKQILAVLSTRGVVLVIGFVNSLILARGLGTEGQGQYAIAVTIYTTLFQVFCMGLYSSHTYYLSKDRKNLPYVWGNSIGISVLCGILSLIAAVVVGLCTRWIHYSVALLYLCLLIVPFYLYYYLQQQIFLVINRVWFMNVLEIFVIFVPFISYLFLYYTHKLSVEAVLLTLLFSYLLAGVIGCIKLIWMKTRIGFSFSFYKRCLPMGIKVFVVNLLSFLILKFDLYMVSYFLGDSEAGKYSVAVSLVEIINTFCATITLIVSPKMAAVEDRGKRHGFVFKVMIGAGAAIIIGVCIGEAICGWLIPILYGKQYIDVVGIFRILLLGTLFWALASFYNMWFWTEARYKELIITYSIAIAINLVLNFLVIKRWGLTGVAIASSISYFVVFFVLGYYFAKVGRKIRETSDC